jgi:hypothetical protein
MFVLQAGRRERQAARLDLAARAFEPDLEGRVVMTPSGFA